MRIMATLIYKASSNAVQNSTYHYITKNPYANTTQLSQRKKYNAFNSAVIVTLLHSIHWYTCTTISLLMSRNANEHKLYFLWKHNRQYTGSRYIHSMSILFDRTDQVVWYISWGIIQAKSLGYTVLPRYNAPGYNAVTSICSNTSIL